MGVLRVEKKNNGRGKIIFFECDQCKKTYTKSYKKRFLGTKTGFFCSYVCTGTWKLRNGITKENLFSQKSRNKAKENVCKSYTENKELILDKIKSTYVEKYGVDNISQLQEIKLKKQNTCLQKFGYPHAAQNSDIKQKMINTFQEKYGTNHPLLNEHVKQKALQTMKKKGVVQSQSILESRFFNTLKELFGTDDVEQHILCNNWNIDFYIRSLDVYVQFDGVYWHGLDRPYKVIASSKNRRDTYILKTIVRDSYQNRWFVQNNKILIRITDKIYKKYILNNVNDVQTHCDSLKKQILEAKTLKYITFGEENGILTGRHEQYNS